MKFNTSKHISCIIIARGGSKGIPRKNLLPVCGKPLIYWTIQHALTSSKISDIWVSSDDNEILDYALSLGVNTIERPESISGDNSTSESAWLHAVEFLHSQNFQPEVLVLPQVTSPVRDSDDFDNAIKKFFHEQADSLLSVTSISDYLVWEQIDNKISSINYDFKNRLRRQNMPTRYLENGSFYICTSDLLTNFNNRLGGNITFYELEAHKKFQIDDIEDIKLCEAIMKEYRNVV
ncbi:acylneuraminate cytidylyltransferase family protein [Opitutales bacterium]|nr:acylneuraminate cytidylyltransferase family protein [Opitutales bacterium]